MAELQRSSESERELLAGVSGSRTDGCRESTTNNKHQLRQCGSRHIALSRVDARQRRIRSLASVSERLCGSFERMVLGDERTSVGDRLESQCDGRCEMLSSIEHIVLGCIVDRHDVGLAGAHDHRLGSTDIDMVAVVLVGHRAVA